MERISEIRIAGLRTIDSLRLPLPRMTVLIGENGSGKSSIIEACRILSRVPSERFLSEVHSLHGGPELLRSGSSELRIGVQVSREWEAPLDYEIALQVVPPGVLAIVEERLVVLGTPRTPRRIAFERVRGVAHAEYVSSMGEPSPSGSDLVDVKLPPSEPCLAVAGAWSANPAVMHASAALRAIDVQLPFEVDARWALGVAGRPSRLRQPEVLQAPPQRLELYGHNLTNAVFSMKADREEWAKTLGYVRLGLGDHVEDIQTRPVGGGSITMDLELTGGRRLSASTLSDGELAYLAFVALARSPAERSLLAFDEPDLHIHPGLLVRVVQLLETSSLRQPVLLATHSGELLDSLADPASSVLVCELQLPERRTILRQLDAQQLANWLGDYRGVGHLRSEGYLSHVLQHDRG